MGTRIELHYKLVEILGTSSVYFQPPETIKMEYPCFVYTIDTGDSVFADNSPYHFTKRYQITYISQDPDSDDIFDEVIMLPMCTYDRRYTADNLYHDVFRIYW